MVAEVNKIAFNILSSGRNLYLPGIGSLVIERFGAKRFTRKFIEPPRKIIAFTEQNRGLSLEEEIARIGGTDGEKAHDVYEDWLMHVLDGDTLTIDGVGSLHRDKFTMTDEFATVLNRQGRDKIAVKPRPNTLLYIFASVCCLFALCVAGYVWTENNGKELSSLFSAKTETAAADGEISEPANENTDNAAEVPDIQQQGTSANGNAESTVSATAADSGNVSDKTADTEAATAAAEKSQPEESVTASANGTAAVAESISGRSYVVLGIYSTPENAFRAVGQAQKRMPAVNCRVYNYGARYMVSVYDTDDRAEAVKYMDSVSRDFKDLWVYTKK